MKTFAKPGNGTKYATYAVKTEDFASMLLEFSGGRLQALTVRRIRRAPGPDVEERVRLAVDHHVGDAIIADHLTA